VLQICYTTTPEDMPLYGAVISDNKGNYYLVSARSITDQTENVMALTKYNYQGEKILEKQYSSQSTISNVYNTGYTWQTQEPFSFGSCDVAINKDGILACNYARKMFSGHQANFLLLVSSDTLELIERKSVPYTSHSLNQRVIALSSGKFLTADQGDAYKRAFNISLVGNDDVGFNAGYWRSLKYFEAFHFREGADRSSGYNETFAQMGNIIETANGAAFCASSERTLSATSAPSTGYFGHNESRDAFLQIYNISNKFEFTLVGGEERALTGEITGAEKTALYLEPFTKDTGVIWLTHYTDEYLAGNVKLVGVNNCYIVIWEKMKYASSGYYNNTSEGTYYSVIDSTGNIVKSEVKLGDFNLPNNYDVISDGEKIYFATTEGKNKQIKLNAITIQAPEMLGDVNNDDIINVMDMECIQKSILGIQKLTSSQMKVADIDKNSVIDVIDMELIQKDILGISKIN
jgi:hypothetical protein